MSDSRSAMLDAIRAARLKMVEGRAEALGRHPSSTIPTAPAPRADRPERSTSAAATGSGDQLHVKENRNYFMTFWAQRIESFVHDASRQSLELPDDLTGFDRKELHQLAARFNLRHMSAGTGTARRLVLAKDALFHSAASVVQPTVTELAELVQMPSSRKQRREEREELDERDLYADRSAIKHYQKFKAATNPTARAVDSSLSPEEALAVANFGPRPAQTNGSGSDRAANSAWDAVLSAKGPTAAAQATGPLEEVCTRCGNSNPVDFAVDDWDCSGHCSKCARVTTWTLRAATNADNDGDERRASQRRRTEGTATSAAPQPVVMSADDTVAAARLYDMSDDDVEWIRKQTTTTVVVGPLPIAFALSPIDEATKRARSDAQRGGEGSGGSFASFVIAVSQNEGATPKEGKGLTSSVAKLLDGLRQSSPDALKSWVSVFPAMSSLGLPLHCAVAVTLTKAAWHEQALLRLTRHSFGELFDVSVTSV